jgi:DNA modification methylase
MVKWAVPEFSFRLTSVASPFDPGSAVRRLSKNLERILRSVTVMHFVRRLMEALMANIARPYSNFEHAYLRDLVVREVLITDLLPMNRRARKHRKKQIEQIARSIQTFGFTNPVLIDGNNRVIAGFGRVLAAETLGMTWVPTICLSGMSEAQLRAYAIADNKIAENAEWDVEVLAIEFQYISDLDIDLTITGFATPEIDLIIGEAALDEPEPPIPPLEVGVPVSGVSDLWHLGRHRLICGDATKPETYAALMAGHKAAMVFTDPPYNLKISTLVGKGQRQHREFEMASGEMSGEEFRIFLRDVITRVTSESDDGSLHFFCMDWRHIELLLNVGGATYAELKNICVWDKGRGGMGSLYRSQHEMVVVFKLGQGAHINNIELGKHGRNRTNVWRYPPARPGGEADLDLHPTAKPISLVADAIMDCSHRGDIVLDPFGGSGTTLLAAERAGRSGYLIELDGHYVDLMIRRWQAMTGERAIHAATGRTFDEMSRGRSETSTGLGVVHVK